MKKYNIFTNQKDSLPEGKADLLLLSDNTLNSTLDGEFLLHEKLLSLDSVDEMLTQKLIPAIITKATHNLNPFSSIEFMKLEMNETFDAKKLFREGMTFGKEYELKGNYLILSQGLEVDNANESVSALLSKTDEENSFDILSKSSDEALLFCAGFLLEASRRFHVVLDGGLRMASSLLIADKLREDVLMRLKQDNVTLCTNETNLDEIFSNLSYTPNVIRPEFTLTESEIPMLQEHKLSDKTAQSTALLYAKQNGCNAEEILNEIEILIYSI